MIKVTAIFVFVAVAVFGIWWYLPHSTAPIVITNSGPTIQELEQMGDLVTLKVNVAEVMVATHTGYKGSWLIKGDALLAINVKNAQIVADQVEKEATILLSTPRVIQPRVDHERTCTWDVQKTTWIPWGGDQDTLRDEAMRKAQSLVDHSVRNDVHSFDEARRIAAQILETLYGHVGWRVTVVWRDRGGEAALQSKQKKIDQRVPLPAVDTGRSR